MGIGFTFMGLMAVVVTFVLFDLSDPKSWLMLVSAAAGPVCLYAGLRLRRSKRAIYQQGQVALGRVVRIVRRGSKNAVRTAKNAHVHFAVGGVTHEAAFDAGFAPPPIGLPVWVLYEPSDPRRNVVVGKTSY
jgi:hypothetical protein